MARSVADVEGLLRERGFALTPQRRAIVRHLVGKGGHWTAAELLSDLTQEFPMASRATIYSTLSLLRELGLVAEISGAGGELRFDANTEPHQHFLCRRCGRLEDVPAEWFPISVSPEAKPKFVVENFRLVAEGLCEECK